MLLTGKSSSETWSEPNYFHDCCQFEPMVVGNDGGKSNRRILSCAKKILWRRGI